MNFTFKAWNPSNAFHKKNPSQIQFGKEVNSINNLEEGLTNYSIHTLVNQ